MCTLGEGSGCAHLHGEAVESHTFLGRLMDVADGLCPSCSGRLGLALDELPRLVAELSLASIPTMEVQYRTVDITSSAPLYPPIPIDEQADALIRLIDHEVTTWAELVADAAGLAWSSADAAASRWGHRIQASCQLLGYRRDQWLALPAHEYRARSLTVNPWSTAGEDDVTRYGDDYWCSRDGVDAAVLVLDLHHRASRFTGGGAADHIPIPCGYCNNRTLRRDHESGVVRCRTCGDTKTDDGYDTFLLSALNLHSQPVAC